MPQQQNLKPLLILARKTIESEFTDEKYEVPEEIKKKYSEQRACFVTLTKKGNLRGCIGSLEARQELWKDVQENAIHSAFDDPRFSPLNDSELNQIKIEISVLTKPEKLDYKNSEDLLKKLNSEMGVIISLGYFSATYLPQVWEQIDNKEEFLSSLCMKAGLSSDEWKNGKLKVEIYRVEKIEE